MQAPGSARPRSQPASLSGSLRSASSMDGTAVKTYSPSAAGNGAAVPDVGEPETPQGNQKTWGELEVLSPTSHAGERRWSRERYDGPSPAKTSSTGSRERAPGAARPGGAVEADERKSEEREHVPGSSAGAGPAAARAKVSAEALGSLRALFGALEAQSGGAVRRQDLLSISAKLRDAGLLASLRSDPLLRALLMPELWGRNLLRSFKDSELVKLDDFARFWGDFLLTYRTAFLQSGAADEAARAADEGGAESWARRDSYDSWRSFSSSASSQPPPNISLPPAARRVLRTLSVRSSLSSGSSDEGHELGKGGESAPREGGEAAPREGSSPSQRARHHQKQRPESAIRVAVSSALSEAPSAPQMVTVPAELAYAGLLARVQERLGVRASDQHVLVHALLRAQVTRVDDLRDGDALLLMRAGYLPVERVAAAALLPVGGASASAPASASQTGGSPRADAKALEAEHAEDECDGAAAAAIAAAARRELPAVLARRPSWKMDFSARPLPAPVQRNLVSVLRKIALSSNRWQRESDLCPSLAQLKASLDAVDASQPMSLERCNDVVASLGIAFGLGRTQLRVLFGAVDQHNEKVIAVRHFKELIMTWHSVWNETQLRIRRANEAVSRSMDMAQESAVAAFVATSDAVNNAEHRVQPPAGANNAIKPPPPQEPPPQRQQQQQHQHQAQPAPLQRAPQQAQPAQEAHQATQASQAQEAQQAKQASQAQQQQEAQIVVQHREVERPRTASSTRPPPFAPSPVLSSTHNALVSRSKRSNGDRMAQAKSAANRASRERVGIRSVAPLQAGAGMQPATPGRPQTAKAHSTGAPVARPTTAPAERRPWTPSREAAGGSAPVGATWASGATPGSHAAAGAGALSVVVGAACTTPRQGGGGASATTTPRKGPPSARTPKEQPHDAEPHPSLLLAQRCASEEDFLRELHHADGDDPYLLLGYASLLLDQVAVRAQQLTQSAAAASRASKAAAREARDVSGGSVSLSLSEGSSLLGRGQAAAALTLGLQQQHPTPAAAEELDSATLKRVRKARDLLKRALSATLIDAHVAEKRADAPALEAVRRLRGEVLCRLAESCEAMNNVSQARSLYHKAVEEAPREPSLLAKYGLFLLRSRDPSGARDYLLEALVLDREHIDALLGYAMLLSASSDPADVEEAAAYFERARVAAEGTRGSRELRARVMVQVSLFQNAFLGQHEPAVRSLERAVELDPRRAEAWFELGRLRFAALGDATGAVDALEACVRADPAHAAAHVALAQILANSVSKTDVDRAELIFARAVDLDPADARMLLSYAEFTSRVARSESRAEELFERAFNIASAALRPACLCKWGEAHERRADRATDASGRRKAAALYEKAAQLVRQRAADAAALRNAEAAYAGLLSDKQTQAQAQAQAQGQAQQQHDQKELQQQRDQLARPHTASVLEPHAAAELCLYLVAYGRCLLRGGGSAANAEHARAALREVVDARQGGAEAKWLLALAEQALGKRARAGKLFRAAYEEDSRNGHVLCHFSRFLLDYQGPPEAQQERIAESMLRKALQLGLAQEKQAGPGAAQPAYFDSFLAIAMVTLGRLLCRRGKTTLAAGIELLARACERCPKAAEPKFFYAEALCEDLLLGRCALYATPPCAGTEGEPAPAPAAAASPSSEADPAQASDEALCARAEDGARAFVSASELDDGATQAPLNASLLLLFLASRSEGAEQRQATLERAQKYAERAYRRLRKLVDARPAASSLQPGADHARSRILVGLRRRLAEAAFLAGVSLERQRVFGEADERLREALELDPGHVLAAYHLARVAELADGDLERAEELALAALALPAPQGHDHGLLPVPSDLTVLCQQLLRDYELAEARFLLSEGEAAGAEPAAARSLVMHQLLARKAQEILDLERQIEQQHTQHLIVPPPQQLANKPRR